MNTLFEYFNTVVVCIILCTALISTFIYAFYKIKLKAMRRSYEDLYLQLDAIIRGQHSQIIELKKQMRKW